MKLKEKTRRKFVDYFDKISQMHQGKEFELAYSDIQRETGTASVTLRRAVQALQEEGILSISAGHNSRYARFVYLPGVVDEEPTSVAEPGVEEVAPGKGSNDWSVDLAELQSLVEHLRHRVRAQEMTVASLQDRLAEMEDKLYKRNLPAIARDFSANK